MQYRNSTYYYLYSKDWTAQIITAMSLCASRNDRIAGKLKEENAVTSPGAILGLFAYEISPYISCLLRGNVVFSYQKVYYVKEQTALSSQGQNGLAS